MEKQHVGAKGLPLKTQIRAGWGWGKEVKDWFSDATEDAIDWTKDTYDSVSQTVRGIGEK